MGYERIPAPLGDPFADVIHVDGHIEYCAICNDWYDDEPSEPCDHLCWSDDECQMVGSGKDDSETHDAVATSIRALCARLSECVIKEMRATIAMGDCDFEQGMLGAAFEDLNRDGTAYGGEGFEAAFCWLDTLGPGKPLAHARERTIEWLTRELKGAK